MAKLNFDRFHPLDHWPFTARCRSLPGGSRDHLSLTWSFQRREQALKPVYWLLLCRIGRHAEQVWYRQDKDGTQKIMPSCAYCSWTRLPSEHDRDAGDALPRFE